MKTLSDVDINDICSLYLSGVSYTEISKTFGISNRRTRQILTENKIEIRPPKLRFISGYKVCTKCNLSKALDCFQKRKEHRDGRGGVCKECFNKRVRDSKRMRLNKYKITPLDYESMLISQDYKCSICGLTAEEKGIHRLCVDHCHETGRVRGLLCHHCNNAIGWFGDNAELISLAIDYILEFNNENMH